MRKICIILISILFTLPSYGASLINDTETESLLYELISPLATAANIPDGRLKIHIVRDDDFNAFVTGGEDVYIYTGLLTRIRNPNALQAVIAHELGHTLGGHMAQMSSRMDAELKRTMLIQALGIGLMAAGGNPSLGAGVMAGASGVATQSMLAFSRDEERMADSLGLDLMVRANQNPNGFIDVFEQMNEMSHVMESRINPNRVNHPLTGERLKNIRDKIAELPTKHTPDYSIEARRNTDYELVRAKLVGYLDTPSRVYDLYPVSDTSDAALYARAITRMNTGNFTAARIGTERLLSCNPDNGYFYELLGDIEYQSGDYDASIRAYNHSLKLLPDSPQIQTALALVYTERRGPGDIDNAVRLCKTALLHSQIPLTYWVLARAYGENDGRGDWARAEYYKLQGDAGKAREYARRAQNALPRTAPEYIKAGDILTSGK